MTSVSDPYVEAGFGVENIFRLFRVDCIWRLTHRSPKPGQEIQNFAVNLSLHLKFCPAQAVRVGDFAYL